MDLVSVCSIALRNKLLYSTEVTDIVGVENARIYLLNAPAKGLTPYIRLKLLWGGYGNMSQRADFDMTWSVCAVSEDNLGQANELAGALSDALLLSPDKSKYNRWIEYPAGFLDWAGVTFIGEYNELEYIQGKDYFVVGPNVRLRGERIL